MAHDKHAPSLPQVVDEAPDTPAWVPALGLGLFALVSLIVAIQLAWADANPAAGDAGAQQASANLDGGTPAP